MVGAGWDSRWRLMPLVARCVSWQASAAPSDQPDRYRPSCGSRRDGWPAGDRLLRPARAAADRHHRARGQRGHRQDVHHRRPGHPLRRRGRRDDGPAARRQLQPGVDPRAARAGTGTARLRPRRHPRAARPRRRGPRPPDLRRRRRAAQRRRRLEEALATFDAATVTTTHGFCQEMLLALGTAGDLDPDAVLVEDLSDLVREVADDLYLRQWGRPDADPPALKPAEFRELATAAAKDRTSDPAARTGHRRHARAAGAHRRRSTERGRQAQAAPAPHRLRRPAAAPRRRARPTR